MHHMVPTDLGIDLVFPLLHEAGGADDEGGARLRQVVPFPAPTLLLQPINSFISKRKKRLLNAHLAASRQF